MELTGNVAGIIKLLGGGEGSTVTIEPLITSGLQIAKVTIDEEVLYLYIPTPQDVDIDAVLTSGTKIAEITINEEVVEIYAPSPTNVNITPTVQSGTKIADISVNGIDTELYAPEGKVIYSTNERKIGKFLNDDLYDITIDLGVAHSFSVGWNKLPIEHQNKYKLIFGGMLITDNKLGYQVNIASNDPTYLEIGLDIGANGRYVYFQYTKNS